jgi:hypothetical protein
MPSEKASGTDSLAASVSSSLDDRIVVLVKSVVSMST